MRSNTLFVAYKQGAHVYAFMTNVKIVRDIECKIHQKIKYIVTYVLKKCKYDVYV